MSIGIPLIPPINLPSFGGGVNDVAVKDKRERIPASRLIRDETGWRGTNATIARAVMGAESSYSNTAGNYCCHGLMAVNVLVHAGKYGIPSDKTAAIKWLRDPRNNLSAAYKIWLDQGWDAWEGYTNGRWRQFRGMDPLIDVKSKGTVTGEIGDAAGGVVDAALGPVDEIAGALLNPSTWLRIAKGLGGTVLIVVGVGGLVFVVASKSNTGKTIQKAVIGGTVGKAGKVAGAAKGATS